MTFSLSRYTYDIIAVSLQGRHALLTELNPVFILDRTARTAIRGDSPCTESTGTGTAHPSGVLWSLWSTGRRERP